MNEILVERIFFFLFQIMPPIILFFGWIGNIAGLVTLFKRDLSKLGPVLMYYMLLGIDTVFLFNVFTLYLNVFGIKTILTSHLTCKILNYEEFTLSSFSPFILVYISVDRYLTIKDNRHVWLKKRRIQIIYLAFLVIFQFTIYSPVYIYSALYTDNNNFTNCYFFNSDSSRLLNFIIDFTIRSLIFVLMITFSILLIVRVVKSRQRVMDNYTSSENKSFRKDIRLGVSLILLNLIYILLIIPVNLVSFVFTNAPYNIIILCYYIGLSNYAFNFYLILVTNSLFRRKFFSLFKKKLNNFSLRKANTS